MQVQGQYPHISGPPSRQLACCRYGRSHARSLYVSMRANSRELPLSAIPVSCFHIILGLPGPCFPSTCMSQAVLTAPLERFMCQYLQSLHSFRMRSRSSMPSCANSSMDLMVTMSCGLTLQICLIIALSFRCRRWRFGFVNGQVSLAWSIALRTQEVYTWPRVLKERWWEERTGSRSLNFFQAVFTCVVVEVHSHQLLRACLLGSKRKLPPPASSCLSGPTWTPLWSDVQGACKLNILMRQLHCTVCHSIFNLFLLPLFAVVGASKFKEGLFHFKNSGMKGLMFGIFRILF